MLAVVVVGIVLSAPLAGQYASPDAWEVPRTPWGAPDLQGIWDSKSTTPMQRPARFADREFLTDDEIAALEEERDRAQSEGPQGRDVRAEAGTEADVEGAYNNIFSTGLGTNYSRSMRSSLIKDPPDGRVPPLTAEAQERREAQAAAAGGASPLSRNSGYLFRLCNIYVILV